jgi:hypothetical protein
VLDALNDGVSDNGRETALSSINGVRYDYKSQLWTRTPLSRKELWTGFGVLAKRTMLGGIFGVLQRESHVILVDKSAFNLEGPVAQYQTR